MLIKKQNFPFHKKQSKFFVLAQKEKKFFVFSKKKERQKKINKTEQLLSKKWTKKIGSLAAIYAKFEKNVLEAMCLPKTKIHFTFHVYILVKCHFANFLQNRKKILKLDFSADFSKKMLFLRKFKKKSEKKKIGFFWRQFLQNFGKMSFKQWVFSKKKNPFHLMILKTSQNSILLETPLILALVLNFSTRQLFSFFISLDRSDATPFEYLLWHSWMHTYYIMLLKIEMLLKKQNFPFHKNQSKFFVLAQKEKKFFVFSKKRTPKKE